MSKRVAPFGAWKSPISAESLARTNTRQTDIVLDGDDVLWTELRPHEGGRRVIVRRRDGIHEDLIAPPFSARTLVHEYGGRCVSVHQGEVVFSNFADQMLYRLGEGETPTQLVDVPGLRFADPIHDPTSARVICVCEDHRRPDAEATNRLVSVPLDGSGDLWTLAEGDDFYSSPTLSHDGRQLAWISWRHPNMPFDSTRLWIADRDETGHFGPGRVVAGGATESVLQPRFSPDGHLTFVSDRSGWANLYRFEGDDLIALCPMDAEFAQPQWTFGTHDYDYADAETIICAYRQHGRSHLARVPVGQGTLHPLELPFSSVREMYTSDDALYLIGASPTTPSALVRYTLANAETTALARSTGDALDAAHISVAEAISFPTGQDETAHAFFYPPANADFQGPAARRPPCVVFSHGGPTSATTDEWRPLIQFWTSRGFAVVDVNYRGSTGYGRAYRERLYGQWGLLDVEDCVAATRYLVERGDIDGDRLAIRGGSAGGYTTLMAVTFTDVFKAGASHFGVSDLVSLAQETHKFESRYLDQLLGPYPEAEEVYLARSPIRFADQIACPMIFLQGLEDKAVPPAQAEKMVAALDARGVPVAYVPFAEEQHGFRKAENIQRALEAELYFYCRIFGLPTPEGVPPVDIAHLETPAGP